jgi:hypothetical protein
MEETYTVSWMMGGFDVVSDWQVFESYPEAQIFYDEILRDEKLVTANISKNIASTEWY